MLFYVDIYGEHYVFTLGPSAAWSAGSGIEALGAEGPAVLWPAPRGKARSGYIVVCPD